MLRAAWHAAGIPIHKLCPCILDGELVAHGLPDSRKFAPAFVVFDAWSLKGRSLRSLELLQRVQLLEHCAPLFEVGGYCALTSTLLVAAHVRPPVFLAHLRMRLTVAARPIEGFVAKDVCHRYDTVEAAMSHRMASRHSPTTDLSGPLRQHALKIKKQYGVPASSGGTDLLAMLLRRIGSGPLLGHVMAGGSVCRSCDSTTTADVTGAPCKRLRRGD